MTTVMEARRIRLRELIAANEPGGQATVARVTEKDRRQVSAWATGRKAISEDTARAIEAAFGKPRGWMDRLNESGEETINEHPPQLPGASHSVQWDSASLTEAERWVRFEEGAGAVYTPERRARRFAALYDECLENGGHLTPERSAQVIDAARARQAEGRDKHGNGGKSKGPGGRAGRG